ncbi:hypothetical protein Landi51_13655 [Colletotrichum acutatum]
MESIEEPTAIRADITISLRSKPQPACRYMMENRQSIFSVLSINEIIAISTRVAARDLKSRRNLLKSPKQLKQLGLDALAKQQAEGRDFTIESEIFLRSLKGEILATATVGTYLFMGFSRSCMRRMEASDASKHRATNAIRLTLPAVETDFLLSIWVSAFVGRDVRSAISGPFEDLEFMFGSFLYGAMSDSCAWQEGRNRASEVLSVVDAEYGDYKMEIKICFQTGQQLYFSLFPFLIDQTRIF